MIHGGNPDSKSGVIYQVRIMNVTISKHHETKRYSANKHGGYPRAMMEYLELYPKPFMVGGLPARTITYEVKIQRFTEVSSTTESNDVVNAEWRRKIDDAAASKDPKTALQDLATDAEALEFYNVVYRINQIIQHYL